MKKRITTQEDIREFIVDIEKKWPVDEWIISGVHIWPDIRIKIYIHLLSQIFANPEKKSNFNNDFRKLPVLIIYYKKGIRIIKAFFNLITLFLRLKNKKIIFFGAHYHRIIVNGEYFNRFYDSMIDHHDLKNDVYMLEYRKICSPYYNNNAVINLVKFLDDYKLITKLFNKKGSKKTTYQLSKFDEFQKELTLKIPGISKQNLFVWSQKINSLQGFYELIYKKVKPQKVVFLRYYGVDDLTAAIICANKLNIETVDLQHGTQINNMAYTNWTKVPSSGFNTVTKVFCNKTFSLISRYIFEEVALLNLMFGDMCPWSLNSTLLYKTNFPDLIYKV